MANLKPALEGVSIVLIGKFNPAFFHPAWFAALDLVRKKEADTAENVIVLPNLATFKMDWLHVYIDQQRFQVSTSQQDCYPVLRDLAVSTFKILTDTPIVQLGVNMDSHMQMPSVSAVHNLGDALAPKALWTDLIDTPLLRTMTMQAERPSSENDDERVRGHVNMKVEPSMRVHPGVYFNINDHFELVDMSGPPLGSEPILGALDTDWDRSLERSRNIRDGLIAKVVDDGS